MGALSSLGTFLDFNTPKSLSWVSESFREDIGEVLTWKIFFISNIFIYEKFDLSGLDPHPKASLTANHSCRNVLMRIKLMNINSGFIQKVATIFKDFSRTTFDFHGTPTRNVCNSTDNLYKNAHSQSIVTEL